MLEVINFMISNAAPGCFLLIHLVTREVIVTGSLEGFNLTEYYISTTDGEPEDILMRFNYYQSVNCHSNPE